MKIILYPLFLIFLSISLFAQEDCAFSLMLNHYEEHGHTMVDRNELDYTILYESLNVSATNRSDDFIIPVVVHVIHSNGEENISDELIERGIEQMNEAFSNTAEFFHPEGVEIPIRFCLAPIDPEGNFSTGILRVENDLSTMHVPSEDAELKSLSQWDTEKYLNIWLVKSIVREPNSPGVVGYSTFPSEHGSDVDGIVCESQFFGVDGGQSKVHIHEVGHYLGLYHTFENGCPNDDCQTSGDRVCDTPPDQQSFTVFCYDGTNSCLTDEDDESENNPFRAFELGGLGDQVDQQINFMDYSNLLCFTRFTEGQSARMQATLAAVRASLFDGDRCTPPCSNPFNVTINYETLDIEVGESISFTANGNGFELVEWYVDDVLLSTGNTFDFLAENEGEFELLVSVSNEELGCTQEFEYNINVSCGVSAFFNNTGSTWPVGITLNFVNLDPNANSWEWSINGELVSTNSALEYTFNSSGIFSIQLIVSNGLCTDGYAFNVAIGNCLTGNEANKWIWQNVSGEYFGFNFNEGEELLLSEQPNISVPFNHNKATFSDAAGNLRYVSTGTSVLDANFQLLQNGSGLSSNTSAHYGSIFIRKPGSDHEVYLFTCSSQEDFFIDGLRYNLIDDNLNNGIGGIVEGQKDLFLDNCGFESAVTIRHCNLVDFWIVYYDQFIEKAKAQLFTENGPTGDPVISDITDLTIDPVTQSFSVNPAGDMIQRNHETYSFDSSTGELNLINQFVSDEVYKTTWSSSGRYVYFYEGAIDLKIYRLDTSLPFSEWNDNVELIADANLQDYGKGFDLAPNGVIYTEGYASGWIGGIQNADFPLGEVIYNPQFIFTSAFINGFQNNHHAYISGPRLFLEGDTTSCVNQSSQYQVFRPDCVTAPIDWSIEGSAIYNEVSNGIVELEFLEPGNVILTAKIELACGTIEESINIHVNEELILNLGPDFNICEEHTFVLDAGEGFDSYHWSNGSEEQTVEIDAPQIISVEVSLGNCNSTDEVEVLGVISGLIDLGPDLDICEEIVILNAGNDFDNYYWQDGLTGPNYTVFEAGTYYVIADTPCFATDTVVVTDCGEVINSISNLSSKQDIVWPNPSASIFNVQLGKKTDLILIYDSRGRKVHELRPGNSDYFSIEVHSWTAGVYRMILISENQTRSLNLSVLR